MAKAFDPVAYDALKAQGLADREIARQWDIPWGTFSRWKKERTGQTLPLLPASEGHETGVPARVPQQKPLKSQLGTQPGTPPSMDVDGLAEAVASQLFPMMQGWLERQVPTGVPYQVPEESRYFQVLYPNGYP